MTTKKRQRIGSRWRLAAGGCGREKRVHYESDGEHTFDELVVPDLQLHIEQMDTRQWWMCVGEIHFGLKVERDGTVTMTVTDGVEKLKGARL